MKRALRQALAIAALALLPALVCGALQLQRPPAEALPPGQVLPATAKGWGAQVLWVDARPRSRFEAAHIPGALLLNEEEWPALVPAFLDAWDPDGKVVVYCDGGGCEASQHVAERLRSAMNLQNIYVLKGGWPAWQRE